MVALTGFMGAGKTTVGRALASLLDWSFFDLDHEIELRQKLLVRELFQLHGEEGFREIETDTLRSLLQQASSPTVIALGGGTFVRPANAELLRRRGVRIVFLETAIEELQERCRVADQNSPENPRPLAATPEAFHALYARRLPFYRNADITVDATGKEVEQLAREIVSNLHLYPRLH
ncbi:MAG: shikimate kinase [Candidatus Korobacteraceae bacterium]